MNKITLGLDLGTNSIGWALVESDEYGTPFSIIDMGARIIPLSSDEKDQFAKGQTIAKNKDRTLKRTQRKGYDRRGLRKKYLKELLENLNISPDKELMKLPTLDLWQLRNDAVNPEKNITAKELARVFYLLNQKRGYKSARSDANADAKDTKYVEEVKSRHAYLRDTNQTIGQYLYKELKSATDNNSYFRKKEKIYPREAYLEEFDKIIDVQKQKQSFLTDTVIHQLRNEIIFYQRKLKSQKGLVSICEFEGKELIYTDKITKTEKKTTIGPKVAPRSSPLFQLCKIWETVNNITIKVKNPPESKYKWSDRILTLEEKERIAAYLYKNEKLTYENFVKILGYDTTQIYANAQIKKGLQGNLTYTVLYKILKDEKLLQFDFHYNNTNKTSKIIDTETGEVFEKDILEIDKNIEFQPLYQLWHTIYSIKDVQECINALIHKFDLPEVMAAQLAAIDFNKQAYGNKSHKAIRKILPLLMQGHGYDKACEFVGYNHSNSLTKEQQQDRATDDILELLKKNSLRQPVVEKILNQMVNVVNAIIKEYGKPDEIRVELARELKQSREERYDADKSINDNKRINEEIVKRLKEAGIPETKKFIQKYKYIYQIRPTLNEKGKPNSYSLKDAKVKNQCIYCGKSFNLTEAMIGSAYDVDHIVPKDLLFDDSQTNKVLVHRSCNSQKLNKTAYDYMASKGKEALDDYLIRVDAWYKEGILTYNKMQRLKVSYEEYLERKKTNKTTEADKKLWESFIDRQLRQTQYIARKSKDILSKICNKITTTEGTVTATLRHLWGWDDVLMNLQLPKYKELNKTELVTWTSNHGNHTHSKEQIVDWTKRDDHRHHAIDALVIACTKQGFIQRINTLNSSETKNEMELAIKEARKKEIRSDEKLSNSENEQTKIYKEKLSKLEQYLVEQRPPEFTTKYVQNHADKILISYKSGKRAATKGKRKISIDNKKVVIQDNVIVPRGELHEQSIYGIINIIDKNKPIKHLFAYPQSIINNDIRQLVQVRLEEHDNDQKKAILSLKKSPIYLDKDNKKVLEFADCHKQVSVLKYKIETLTPNDIPDIVDKGIAKIIDKKLKEHNDNPKEAFKTTVWMNEEKQIPIKSVRLYARPIVNNLTPIKQDENGNPIGFVIQGNNHHVAIYKDNEGNITQHICTLMHAVERKKHKLPFVIINTTDIWDSIIDKDLPEQFLQQLPNTGLTLQYSLQQNEMYILGMKKEEFEEALKNNNTGLLSKYLYLVWKLANNDFYFRHHLETKVTDLLSIKDAKDSKRYYRLSMKGFLSCQPIKVRINHLGKISKIGE